MIHHCTIASRAAPPPVLQAQIRVLGLDPGWAHFGYAVAVVGLAADTRLVVLPERLGTWSTKPSARKQRVRQANDDRRRGMGLAGQLFELAIQARAQMLCAESPVGSRMARQASVLGRANGIVDAVASTCELPLLEAIPVELKKAVAGKGSASKEEIAQGLWSGCLADYLLGSPDVPSDHAYDALAAIVACASTSEVRLMLAAAAAPAPDFHPRKHA